MRTTSSKPIKVTAVRRSREQLTLSERVARLEKWAAKLDNVVVETVTRELTALSLRQSEGVEKAVGEVAAASSKHREGVEKAVGEFAAACGAVLTKLESRLVKLEALSAKGPS